MNKELLQVALRQRAVVIDNPHPATDLLPQTLALVAEMRQLGYCFSEELLKAVNGLSDEERQILLEGINEVMGTKLNWASLTKGWLTPTGTSWWDHFVTFIVNTMENKKDIPGTTLPCGHFIPDGTFPLERYNGCPYCGKPFRTADFVFKGQGTKLKELQLWSNKELHAFFLDLLQSPVALDATQRESLKALLRTFGDKEDFLQLEIKMKETRLLVIDELVALGRDEEAGRLFATPNDVLRFLWYRHTGQVQLLQPRTLLHITRKNHRHEWNTPEDIESHAAEEKQKLRLKYDRPWCRRAARWLNAQITSPSSLNTFLESMHPKREMWVRFIRALRLAEYAKKPGFEALRVLIDRFYRQDYEVWQGQVNRCREERQADETLQLLQQRPGLFARCLFSTMLTFGKEPVIKAFREVMTEVPTRLLLTLGAQAQLYFDKDQQRIARPLSGVMKPIAPHPLLSQYTNDELKAMQQAVNKLYLDAMREHFLSSGLNSPASIYIDPQLFNIPVAVGDRSNSVQDVSAALQGTRFPVEGDSVRLFLQWGKDLPKQHLDMDLSCHILTETEATVCAYFNLVAPGAKHSGDIQHIPDYVGTAEYVELSLPELEAAKARRVVFTCNAYSEGKLSPNLMVGWMSAKHPMTVDNETGVAYDPSTVQHMVRITESNLSKGLIFGVLDVQQREIIWLEIPFDGQTVLSINPQTIEGYLQKLRAKPTIGQVLQIKAEAQHLTQVSSPDEADEVYTLQWAQNTAQVSRLLLE